MTVSSFVDVDAFRWCFHSYSTNDLLETKTSHFGLERSWVNFFRLPTGEHPEKALKNKPLTRWPQTPSSSKKTAHRRPTEESSGSRGRGLWHC